MFSSASVFNQDLSSWDISGVGNIEHMFYDSGISEINQNKIDEAWSL